MKKTKMINKMIISFSLLRMKLSEAIKGARSDSSLNRKIFL